MTARIFRSELEAMGRHQASFDHIETGGEFFGLWTHAGSPVIYVATGPGRDARHHATSFYQDADYLERCHAEAHDHGLVHLGSWHSHHHLGLAQPSGGDLATVRDALRQYRWPAFVLAIGNFPRRGEDVVEFGFVVVQGRTGEARPVAVDVIERACPLRRLRLPAGRATHGPAPEVWLREPPAGAVTVDEAPVTALSASPWYLRPPAQSRVLRDFHRLAALADEGITAVLRPDGDVLLCEARRGTFHVKLMLSEGYPLLAPSLLAPRIQALPWSPAHGDLALVVARLCEAEHALPDDATLPALPRAIYQRRGEAVYA